MSRHARQALDRSEPPMRETGATPRSGQFKADAQRAGTWAAVPWPPPDAPTAPPAPPGPVQPRPVQSGPVQSGPVTGPRTAARRARKHGAARAGTAGVVAYLAVIVCTAAGVYISWRQGSNGGGKGAVVAGAALLVAAVARLLLPAKAAGLLASRSRVTDVLMLTVFGVGLVVAGLVLPRLGSLSAQGRMAGPPMKGKHE